MFAVTSQLPPNPFSRALSCTGVPRPSGEAVVLAPVSEELADTDIRDLDGYFAALAPPESSAARAPDDHPELTAAGKKAVTTGRCVSCYGDDFAGSKAVARMAGQREDYLAKALHDYKSGLGVVGGVAAVADVAYQLNDQDVAALAHYLSRL
ncbi:c-type cytochrome [Bradyrhizobium sp. HKCCYLS1011]|uniref:c-type cytochrome n=1 Tax=Bradyrhizobium sp. HKCCYLS1011 TaxID=3420733 RepID=UPI003EBD1B54